MKTVVQSEENLWVGGQDHNHCRGCRPARTVIEAYVLGLKDSHGSLSRALVSAGVIIV